MNSTKTYKEKYEKGGGGGYTCIKANSSFKDKFFVKFDLIIANQSLYYL
ncbi:hypothetical protein [uncultured Campylobacter sp.]|nr:hypothetical protein [uncultured Campylobacter sp.]